MRAQGVIRFASGLMLAGALAGSGQGAGALAVSGPGTGAASDAWLSPASLSVASVTHRVDAGSGGYVFDPRTSTIARGDRVVWHNVSDIDHDVTSRLPGYFRSSGRLDVAEQYGKTFKAAGTFRYFCVFHQDLGMTGTIVVPIRVSLSRGVFTIKVASASSSSTKWRNRIQVKEPRASRWRTIATTSSSSITFHPHAHGSYQFRSAVQDRHTGDRSGFSPAVSKVF